MKSNDDYRLSSFDELIVITNLPITEYDQKILSSLYSPIIGSNSTNLYMALYSLIEYGTNESKTLLHKELFELLRVKDEKKFISSKDRLEAMGLLDTYIRTTKEGINIYIYALKKVLSPDEFLLNEVFSNLLSYQLGEEHFIERVGEFFSHRFDLHSYQKITKNIDEVFTIENSINKPEYVSWVIPTSKKKVNINKEHFDFEYFLIRINSIEALNDDILKSTEFYTTINRLVWIYNLTTDDIFNATVSASKNKLIDYDDLRISCQKIYDGIGSKNEIRLLTKDENSTTKLIKALEQETPSKIVEAKFGTKLTGSEITMFDKLLTNTNISHGILNVLIIYVIENKNGEIPSYNYFLKILNTWIRAGIKSTSEALDFISNPKESIKPVKQKEIKSLPTWYNEYQNELTTKLNEKSSNSTESLEDIEAFFKKKK